MAGIRALIMAAKSQRIFIIFFMILSIHLHGQEHVVCSGDLASFEEYQPILYPAFLRRIGVHSNFNINITVIPGGKFTYTIVDPITNKDIVYDLQEAIVNAISGWKFVNDTNKNISIKIKVVFELSGEVQAKDDIVKNNIRFYQSDITIKVIATRIIPLLQF
jgi:hypothetical protein